MIWRIRQRSAFERLAREGVRIRVTAPTDPNSGSSTPFDRPTVWCTFLSDAGAVPPRVAFAFGRAHGTAVRRNRLRRRVRAVLDECDREGRLVPGWYLVGGSPGLTELTFDRLRVAVGDVVDRCASRAARSVRPGTST